MSSLVDLTLASQGILSTDHSRYLFEGACVDDFGLEFEPDDNEGPNPSSWRHVFVPNWISGNVANVTIDDVLINVKFHGRADPTYLIRMSALLLRTGIDFGPTMYVREGLAACGISSSQGVELAGYYNLVTEVWGTAWWNSGHKLQSLVPAQRWDLRDRILVPQALELPPSARIRFQNKISFPPDWDDRVERAAGGLAALMSNGNVSKSEVRGRFTRCDGAEQWCDPPPGQILFQGLGPAPQSVIDFARRLLDADSHRTAADLLPWHGLLQ